MILIIGVVVFIVALAGGALGNEFGGGFLGSPLAAIQIPAESISSEAIVGDYHITNTMIATWVAIVLLLILSIVVRSKVSEIPGRLQGFVEVILEFFLDLAENIAGRERARRFFPLVMTIILFIVVSNWLGIMP
ncbi:MAG: F0F1 ATP synthase subunit A [SAR202 cluster bacterium]|nr:F0F1 ATP synthase subunit A [SAR202 cluster bacterium]